MFLSTWLLHHNLTLNNRNLASSFYFELPLKICSPYCHFICVCCPPLEYNWSLEFQLGLNGMPYLSQVFSCKTKTSLVVSLSIMICNFSSNMYILVSLEWVKSLCWSCFWQTCCIDLKGNWELRKLSILQKLKSLSLLVVQDFFYIFEIFIHASTFISLHGHLFSTSITRILF